MTRARQTVTHVPIAQLRAHPANIRDDLGDLTDMGRSIKEHGILQPLTATEDREHDGKLLLLAGHRRLGGAILANLDVVPVIIRHDITDPAEQLVVMLVENTQRRDLNGMERAQAYGALRNQGLTVSEIARRTGSHVSTVSSYLNLLLLDEEEREEVRTGEVSASEAIAEVRERHQVARAAQGAPTLGRPKVGPYFGPDHRLAKVVRKGCAHRGRGTTIVGGVGCGPCWEQAVRQEAEPSRAEPSRAEPSRAEPSRASDYDEAVVIRRLNGDQTVRTRKADRIEIVRRAQARGMSQLDIERVTGLTKVDRYVDWGLEAS
jgi:ParB family chromosome partitioning protein